MAKIPNIIKTIAYFTAFIITGALGYLHWFILGMLLYVFIIPKYRKAVIQQMYMGRDYFLEKTGAKLNETNKSRETKRSSSRTDEMY